MVYEHGHGAGLVSFNAVCPISERRFCLIDLDLLTEQYPHDGQKCVLGFFDIGFLGSRGIFGYRDGM